jgi:16S rRNA (guanine527-N7)-methyltransferase
MNNRSCPLLCDFPLFSLSGFSSDQAGALQKIYEYIITENKSRRVTNITDPADFVSRHLLDALLVPGLKGFFKAGLRVADLGSGGGFPGLILALAFPDARFVLIDSQEKKCMVMQELVKVSGLNNVSIMRGRFEELARRNGLRAGFDIVTARAVAHLSPLVEYSLPFLRPGGLFIAYKGPDVSIELGQAQNAIKELRGKLTSINPYDVPLMGSAEDGVNTQRVSRTAVLITLASACPKKYPRSDGTPCKNPL